MRDKVNKLIQQANLWKNSLKIFYSNVLFCISFIIISLLLQNNASGQLPSDDKENVLNITRQRAAIYEDCGKNASRLLQGWLDLKQDTKTMLFSKGGEWNYHNEAADHYSSLVLVAYYVNPQLIEGNGALHQTLVKSKELCSDQSGIPTLYNLQNMSRGEEAQLGHLAEWLRDGLIRIVEVMGVNNDWYKEMERLSDAIITEAEKRGGVNEVLNSTEDSGNMLQILTRLYAISGKDKYLKTAEAIADIKLADLASTTQNKRTSDKIEFVDHGCELIPGLGELFALECQLNSPKAEEYKEPLKQLLDKMLDVYGNPETGLFCDVEIGTGGSKVYKKPPDTWGYVLFTYENYDKGTGEGRYTNAIEKPIKWLVENRPDYEILKWTVWPRSSSSDDWSDSYESMIVLWNRDQFINGVFDWLDWSTLRGGFYRTHTKGKEKYGPYTGAHFDGSTGRTLCMHMMLCSQGVRTVPFIEGLRLGGIQKDGKLYLSLESEKEWTGKLCFDSPRTEHKAATINWARINMMPQWFVARPDKKYSISIFGAEPKVVDGQKLIDGIEMNILPRQIKPIEITPLR